MRTRPQAFLLDENIPRKVASVLGMAGYAATRVYDVGLRSQPDAAIFAYARTHQMTIITFDTDYLKQSVFPPPHAGILVLRFFPRNTSTNELAEAVLKVVALLADLDVTNHVYRLDPHGLEEVLS